MKALTTLLRRLDAAKIHYKLDSVRAGYVMVTVAVPGQRWEIEFSEDGEFEIEVFTSTGEVRGREALNELFASFSD